MYYTKKTKKLIIYTVFSLMIGCEEQSNTINNPNIDPHIVFSSRRWWNYDIYLTDVYNSSMSHITKNKYIDFNPAVSPDSKNLHSFLTEMVIGRYIFLI